MYLVVGIGKLAQSILKLNSYREKIYVYSRTKTKVDEIEDERVSYIGKEEFHKASHVFLMLPASEIVPFLESNHSYFKEDVIFYSFATALLTKDISTIPTIIPCKLAGHAKQMVEDQRGLFVVPEGVNCEPLVDFFGANFIIMTGTEEEVLIGNTLATKAAIEMIINLEEKLIEAGIQKSVIEKVICQGTRGSIKTFLNNDLGGFAQKIVADIKKERV